MTTAITKKEPMRLTSENVEAVFIDCLANDKTFVVKGVNMSAAFDKQKVEAHKEDIIAMLSQTPTEFHASGGSGWTFLNLCIDNNATQWTDFHHKVDELVCLGLAIEAVEFTIKQRELWQCFPGGMPYITIKI
ncbi:MAG: hypothetical protein NC328_02405 [Muribaculum sp.]|nr:hypothetical protein [Muribaculum sp.]